MPDHPAFWHLKNIDEKGYIHPCTSTLQVIDWYTPCSFTVLEVEKGYTILLMVERETPCTSILLIVERDTPCTSILLMVERDTPFTSILMMVERETPCTSMMVIVDKTFVRPYC
jgi:hypothetical protein